MIIFGTRSIESTQGTGHCFCPRCQTQQPCRQIVVRRWFTLYFIPVIPLGRLGEYVQCGRCAATFSDGHLGGPMEPMHDDEFVQMESVVPLQPGHSSTPAKPALAPSMQPLGSHSAFRAVKTCSLATISLALGALSPLLICVCGLSLLSSLAAVVTGHVALAKIRGSAGKLAGQGMAIAGLVLGYVFALLSVVVIALFLPPFLQGINNARERELAERNPAQRTEMTRPNPWVDSPVSPPDPPEAPSFPIQPEEGNDEDPATIDGVELGGRPGKSDDDRSPTEGRKPGDASSLPVAKSGAKEVERSKRSVATSGPQGLDRERVLQQFPDLGWNVTAMEFSSDGQSLMLGKLDSSLILFDVRSGRRIVDAKRVADLDQVTAIRDAGVVGQWWLGDQSGKIALVQVDETNQLRAMPIAQLGQHGQAITCLAWDRQSGLLVSGGKDKQLIGHDLKGPPRLLATLKGPVQAVRLLSELGPIVATDGKEVLWIDREKFVVTRRVELGSGYCHSADISADGARVICSEGSSLRVWQVEDGTSKELSVKGSGIHWTVRFGQGGVQALSGGRGVVHLWDLNRGAHLGEIRLGSVLYVQTLALSHDGESFAAVPSAAGQTAYVFRLVESR